MDSFNNQKVVVTGAASGIGRALAIAFAKQGCKLALIDVDVPGLAVSCEELAKFCEPFSVVADVSIEADVEGAKIAIEDAIGAVDILCNNAGVGFAGSALDVPDSVWNWMFGVNVLGVLHCTRAFVPQMVERDHGFVMNVASVAGLLAPAGMAAYVASKHAVVGYTESLFHELASKNSKVSVSLACPGMVDTAISSADRNWPDHLGERPSVFDTRTALAIQKRHQRALGRSMSPDAAAEIIVESMRNRHFWVFTDDVYIDDITAHADTSQPPVTPKYL